MAPRQREKPLCLLVMDKTRWPMRCKLLAHQTPKSCCYVLQSSWRPKQLMDWGSREEHATLFSTVPSIKYLASGLLIRWLKYGQKIQMSLLTGEDPDAGKRLKAKGEEGGRGWDGWITWPPNGHELEQIPGEIGGQGSLVCCVQVMGLQRVRQDWATEHHHHQH